jgi:stage II sporulation protein R
MKKVFLLVFALVVALMSWEDQLNAQSLAGSGPIPQESIRLRIIANSDSLEDQWLKREVRDSIVARMNDWAKNLKSYEEARSFVKANLPELQQLVEETIHSRGFSYPAVVEFGKVPFPTKLYGAYVYPAGDYEALRVRIGEAKGENWWCVLFPPLCFIDMSNGDAVAQSSEEANTEDQPVQASPWETETDQSGNYADQDEETTPSEAISPEGEETSPPQPVKRVEVRFFLWEKLMALF